MACDNEHSCGNQGGAHVNTNGYLIVLVLYILLAILLGSYLYY